ncbi:putative LRR receptor-like serine/threonine-protein kinase [Cinnamomum micranthum f. kanehirae]|uniref:Putative LRR receptor-like serine/threonine-protein kinase n=1 Tax=Cinnamomum micranthum f. kanehirae TaxID=337451 RepID=A0A3S3N6W2_9MAGN|nr:putative LRR receptor-like serine/threonine-protein kinase [Cinnamomum micranthum f. kanehirae]
MGGEASTEGDVYSYRIMLLELFTGKRPTDDMFEGGLSLHEFAKRAMPTQVIEIVDQLLLLEGNADSNNVNGRYEQIARVNECLVSIVGIGIVWSLESPGEHMQMVDVVKRLVALRDPLLG